MTDMFGIKKSNVFDFDCGDAVRVVFKTINDYRDFEKLYSRINYDGSNSLSGSSLTKFKRELLK